MLGRVVPSLLLVIVALTGCGAPVPSTSTSSPAEELSLPTVEADCQAAAGHGESQVYAPYKPLMLRRAEPGPLYATGQDASYCSLVAARSILAAMLAHRSDLVAKLRGDGALIAVTHGNETTCDTPYFAHFKESGPCYGGGGGVPSSPATVCPESNLLRDASDPWHRDQGGENICVHELGHMVMNVAVTDADRQAIEARYSAVVADGNLWNGTWAGTHGGGEFWAEVTQSYFCANPDEPGWLHNGIDCADELKAYDPESFALVDGIYGGSANLS